MDELRALPFGESVKTDALDCADGTVRAYLSDMSAADERYSATPNGDGTHTIKRQRRKVYKGHINKSELQNRLFTLKHGQIFSCHRTDLAMSMARANAIIGALSNKGVETPMFVRGEINDKLFVVCLWDNIDNERYEDEFETARKWQPELPSVAFKPQPKPIDDDPEVDWRGQGDDDDEGPII